MPGPYDYTVNIPQPPAQNFLQSLTGIMQLRQMQQQSEIAAQQQAFAVQQQPLQTQQLEAQIAASQASAAHSGAATNLLGVQTEETKRRNQQLADFQSEALKLSDAPESWNASNLKSLAMKSAAVNPESFNAMRNLMADLPNKESNLLTSAASTTLLAVQQGKPDIAKSVLDDQIKAAEDAKLGTAITFLKAARSQLDTNPEAAALSATSFLLSANPKAFDDTLKALEAPGKMAQTAALTEEAQAKAAKARGESATGEVEIKDVFTKKLLKDSIDKAKEYSEKADTALSILDKIDSGEVSLPSGFIGNAVQYVRDKVPALANDITALKKDYIRIKNSEAIKNLPKGSASDKDVAFAKEGLMSENANPAQFRNAVEAMARLNSVDSSYNEAQAAWVSRNGNIGDAKREISVLGDMVPKGTGFREWWKKSGSSLVSGQVGASAPTKTDQITGTPDLTGGTINLGGGNTATFKLKK